MKQGQNIEPHGKLVYIASPYAGDIEGNTQFAVACCRDAIRQGYTPIAPHLLYPQMLDDEVPEERMLALMLGRNLLAACDEVWVCGERISSGMEGEIEHARSLDIPIRYIKEIAKREETE